MGIFNQLSFVKKSHEHGDVYTFYFKKPKRMAHKAGQHGLFILPALARPHVFSLSSAPEEEFITISTHVRTKSRYKQRLANMKPEQKVIFIGPVFNFTFKESNKDHVFLAQGIGITPFRSMLVHARGQNLPITTTLIHVEHSPHTFKNVTKKHASNAFYPTTSDEFRQHVLKQDIRSTYYLSGSPAFIAGTKKLLRQRGIRSSRIYADLFLGY